MTWFLSGIWHQWNTSFSLSYCLGLGGPMLSRCCTHLAGSFSSNSCQKSLAIFSYLYIFYQLSQPICSQDLSHVCQTPIPLLAWNLACFKQTPHDSYGWKKAFAFPLKSALGCSRIFCYSLFYSHTHIYQYVFLLAFKTSRICLLTIFFHKTLS